MKPIIPSIQLAGSDWKALIQSQKQKVINERIKQHQPTESNGSTSHHSVPNQVKVIDKSYLKKRNYMTQHEKSIDLVCMKYKLNQEQECAFKIIAHHVVMPNSGQLRM